MSVSNEKLEESCGKRLNPTTGKIEYPYNITKGCLDAAMAFHGVSDWETHRNRHDNDSDYQTCLKEQNEKSGAKDRAKVASDIYSSLADNNVVGQCSADNAATSVAGHAKGDLLGGAIGKAEAAFGYESESQVSRGCEPVSIMTSQLVNEQHRQMCSVQKSGTELTSSNVAINEITIGDVTNCSMIINQEIMAESVLVTEFDQTTKKSMEDDAKISAVFNSAAAADIKQQGVASAPGAKQFIDQQFELKSNLKMNNLIENVNKVFSENTNQNKLQIGNIDCTYTNRSFVFDVNKYPDASRLPGLQTSVDDNNSTNTTLAVVFGVGAAFVGGAVWYFYNKQRTKKKQMTSSDKGFLGVAALIFVGLLVGCIVSANDTASPYGGQATDDQGRPIYFDSEGKFTSVENGNPVTWYQYHQHFQKPENSSIQVSDPADIKINQKIVVLSKLNNIMSSMVMEDLKSYTTVTAEGTAKTEFKSTKTQLRNTVADIEFEKSAMGQLFDTIVPLAIIGGIGGIGMLIAKSYLSKKKPSDADEAATDENDEKDNADGDQDNADGDQDNTDN